MQNTWDHFQDTSLKIVIERLFGEVDTHIYNEIKSKFKSIEVNVGQTIIRQGDPGDCLYLVLSGRLRVYIDKENRERETVGMIFRGETVGEMALLAGEERSATVVAVRHSTLAQLDRSDFEEIISAHPKLVMNISKIIISRLNRMNLDRRLPSSHITITIIEAGNGSSMMGFIKNFNARLSEKCKTICLQSTDVEKLLGKESVSNISSTKNRKDKILSAWLDEKENEYDNVILIGDSTNRDWTKRCIGQADIILKVADSSGDSGFSKMEEQFAEINMDNITTSQYLVLRHKNEIEPGQTNKWLKDRHIKKHFQVRENEKQDLARLVNYLPGKSVGLVLSGGGAKGLAHIGILKALEEANYTIDLVGGTSIGSIIGGFIAMGFNSEKIIEVSRHMFLKNPTPYSELNIFPVYSLLSGKRLDRMIKECFGSVTIEDLPINYFCVSSNLTQSNFEVHSTGILAKALRASISLPGILTPVIKDKNVLVDGGIFNNLPIDVMATHNVGTIIATSLRAEITPLEMDVLPNKSRFILNQIFKKKDEFAQLPTLMNTFMKTLTANSDKKQKSLLSGADIVFEPDVSRYGLVAWKDYDEIVEVGYRHAKEVLRNITKASN